MPKRNSDLSLDQGYAGHSTAVPAPAVASTPMEPDLALAADGSAMAIEFKPAPPDAGELGKPPQAEPKKADPVPLFDLGSLGLPITPQDLDMLGPGWRARLRAKVQAGAKFSEFMRPTLASAVALQAALESLPSSFEGVSERLDGEAAQKARESAHAAEQMFKAGWCGNGLELAHQRGIWAAIMRAERLDMAKLALKSGMRPWVPTLSGWTLSAVAMAVEARSFEIALELARAMSAAKAATQKGSLLFDLLNFKAEDGDGYPEQFVFLLEAWTKAGLPVDAREEGKPEASTPLMKACSLPGIQGWAVAALLGKGASAQASGPDLRTPLHLVCQRRRVDGSDPDPQIDLNAMECLHALLRAGADPSAKDIRGCKPIDLAKAAGWDEGVARLAAFEEKAAIGEGMADDALRLGMALLEIRRQGAKVKVVFGDGSEKDWDEAFAELGQAGFKGRGLSL